MSENGGKAYLQVRHSIPGRLRVRIRQEGMENRHFDDLREWLGAQEPVISNEVRSSSGTVIIYYDSERVGPSDMLVLLEEGLSRSGTVTAAFPPASECSVPGPLKYGVTGAARVLSSGSIWNLVGLTGFLMVSLIRRFWFRRPLVETPGSATGILAACLTLALAVRTAFRWKKGGRWGLLPFLTAACGLAVFMGEALTAIEILWVLSIGEFLEGFITEKSRRTIGEALRGKVEKAFLLVEGAEVEVPVSQVHVGDVVWVGNGADLPVDGVVVEGEALVDESHITGRAQPEHRKAPDSVFAGTRVVEGFVYVRAEKVGSDTFLSRTLQLVEDSLAKRADVEKRADLLASRLTGMGAIATVVTFLVTRSLQRALSVALVMSCPCATVLATSTALAAAIANAARRGIVVKGGMSLERLNGIDAVCFDKTGTITSDVPEITEIIPRAPWVEEGSILQFAASAEKNSNHPMARGIMQEAARRGIAPGEAEEFESFLGRGIAARWGSQEVLVGNRAFMEERGVNTGYFRRRGEDRSRAGKTVIYVSRSGRLQGMIVLENQVRPGAERVIRRLRDTGVRRVDLISGDSSQVVEALGRSLDLDGYRGDLLPEDKATYISDLESAGRRVLMVGDGVNDALALSHATMGVAMGAGGAEVALVAADISLMKSDLLDLAYVRDLSHGSFQVIEQNFWIAILTDLIGGALGSLGLLAPILGGAVHIAHSLLITWNSSRILTWDMSPHESGNPAQGDVAAGAHLLES